MTPFESATELYRENANSSPFNTLADQGKVNAGRMFDLLAQQKASDLASQREQNRLQSESNIRESERQRLRNESAAQLFATTQQRHPDWKLDPDKSLAENIASAQGQGDQDILDGVKTVAANDQNQKAEIDSILAKYGAIVRPDDPRLIAMVNQQLVRDPTLTTGVNPVLGPREIAMLNSGKTPQQVADTFVTVGGLMPGTQRTLLNAANAAAANIQQQLQDRAAQRGQVEIQAVQNKYSFNNQLKQDTLSSIARNRPDLLPRAASMLGQSSASASPSPARDPNGLLPGSAFGIADPPPSSPSPGSGIPPVTPKSDDPTPPVSVPEGTPAVFNPNYYGLQVRLGTAQKALSDEQQNLSQIQADKAHIESLLATGTTPSSRNPMAGMGGVGMPPSPGVSNTDLYNLAIKHRQLQEDEIASQKKILKLQDAVRDAALPSADSPQPATPPSPVTTTSQQPTIPPLPSAAVAPPVSGSPASVPPVQPLVANGQPSGVGYNGDNFMKSMNARNTLTRIFGTADPNILASARNYAKSVMGMSDDQLNSQLQAAINGDPNAIAGARRVISIVSGSAPSQSSPPFPPGLYGPMDGSTPPVPAAMGGSAVPNTSGATVMDFSQ